jgi:hypothetical protein
MRRTLFVPALALTLPLGTYATDNYGGRGGYGRPGSRGRQRDDHNDPRRDDRHEVREHRQLGKKDRIFKNRDDDTLDMAGTVRAAPLSAHSPAVFSATSSRAGAARRLGRFRVKLAACSPDGQSIDGIFVVHSLAPTHRASPILYFLASTSGRTHFKRGLAVRRYQSLVTASDG